MTTLTMADSYTRFKALEAANRQSVDGSRLHIMRLDGRAFGTYTKGLQAPYDATFAAAMDNSTVELAKELGARLAYVASDELSLVLTGAGPNGDMPFAGNVDKFLSIAASHVAATFNLRMYPRQQRLATFDARIVTVDATADVAEYLQWRQADTRRNAVMMAAHSLFSHEELTGVGVRDAVAMIEARNDEPFEVTYPDGFRLGRQVLREVRTQTFTYTHSRTGETATVTADRSSFVARPAPLYRSLSTDDVAALLQAAAGADA